MDIQITPHKFAPVTFALNYDKYFPQIFDSIINILSNKKTIEKIHIIPNWVEAINKQVVKQAMVKSIHGTLAIEGNTSTEKEIEKVISEEDQKKAVGKKEIETYNIKQAYDFINNFKKTGKDSPILITEDLIKTVHGIITDRTFENNNVPGQYRNFEVKVGDAEHGGVYRPPHILDDIKLLMAGFTKWLNNEDVLKEYAFIRAILAHYYLEIIHPFGDGNGRAGRAIESLILHDFGFKYGSSFALWTSYYANYDKYFSLLSKTRKENEGNQTEFIVFALSILNTALEGVYDGIVNITDKLLFKDYLSFLLKNKEINQRQNAIVEFVLDKDMILKEEFVNSSVIKILYRKMSTRAFPRDMVGLLYEKRLIIRKTVDGKEYYQINIEGWLNQYTGN